MAKTKSTGQLPMFATTSCLLLKFCVNSLGLLLLQLLSCCSKNKKERKSKVSVTLDRIESTRQRDVFSESHHQCGRQLNEM